MARKEKVVSDLTDNVRKLLDGHQVALIHGAARLQGIHEVVVTPQAKGEKPRVLKADKILLATGSTPTRVPGLEFDGTQIVSSTEALGFDAVPKRLGIVGGGYIGLELGSVWRRLGAEVTVIEMLPKIAGLLAGQVGRQLDRILRRQGFEIRTGTRVTGAEVKGKNKAVHVGVETDGRQESLQFDRLLVAVGRRPLTQGLGLEETGIEVDEKTGHVKVDAVLRTSVPSIYAIGDLVPGPMLAHKASAEGIAAVEHMAGRAGEVNYDTIPAVIYTAPEVATVGLTEEQCKARGIPYCVGSYPFSGAGRARCMGQTEGFVKLIAHAKTDRILGVHIIGARAADMIAECVLAMEFAACSEDLARTVHGHPTFAEALQEAAMAVRQCAIHAS
jgi:dihydrolipoamide dehydrogenase